MNLLEDFTEHDDSHREKGSTQMTSHSIFAPRDSNNVVQIELQEFENFSGYFGNRNLSESVIAI